MEIIVTNIWTGESRAFSGDPLTVEEELREVFPAMFNPIPHGRFDLVMFLLNRLIGYSVVVTDSSDFVPETIFRSRRPDLIDPWVRASDLPKKA